MTKRQAQAHRITELEQRIECFRRVAKGAYERAIDSGTATMGLLMIATDDTIARLALDERAGRVPPLWGPLAQVQASKAAQG